MKIDLKHFVLMACDRPEHVTCIKSAEAGLTSAEAPSQLSTLLPQRTHPTCRCGRPVPGCLETRELSFKTLVRKLVVWEAKRNKCLVTGLWILSVERKKVVLCTVNSFLVWGSVLKKVGKKGP